jgi:hypothetical protein
MPEPEGGDLDPAVASALQRVEHLIDAFENDPDEGIQEMATELLQSIDTIHRAGLTRLAELLARGGDPLREAVLADPNARLLFELYDLLPDPAGGFVPLDELGVLERRSS